MENAHALWERLGLPALRPETPWHGYSMGDSTEGWDEKAMAATRGEWLARDESYRRRRKSGVVPNTSARIVEDKDNG